MKIDELFRQISDSYGLEKGIEADEKGVYHIEMDDVVVAFRASADGEKIVSWVEIGTLPKEGMDRLGLCRALLEASFLGGSQDGAHFALEGDTVVLMRTDTLVAVKLGHPMEIAASLAESAKPWIANIEEVNNDAE